MQSQTEELVYEKVTADNLQLALNIQHSTWPREEADQDYLSKLKHPEDTSNISWLVYRGQDLVGITGVFTFDPDEPGYDQGESIWMDWFAILPAFRRQGFGRQVLLDTIAYCRQLGKYKYYRLDTTFIPNRSALFLYDDVMELREEYTAEDTPTQKQHYIIYSKSLDGLPLKPWNNHFLNLGDNSEGNIIV